jgi:hypothetical protein
LSLLSHAFSDYDSANFDYFDDCELGGWRRISSMSVLIGAIAVMEDYCAERVSAIMIHATMDLWARSMDE